ncbi:anhydro-N-acetylmuramic acid kinase [Glaciecola sp. XM2]|jgi:anhydro-N-acetylmuramic acid kinase|uniref:anhydro-N-acetylmuramic acid kinase n=1 Tax=Glaciecola sp. XM2 TaxID=1914931 RepID=UPI001BDE837D|nr:anhydro-N-acetylmuramic acid kinase [Glaciecola sp. XM2]MBT1451821.1 anhydro-N-acetylmuramic acid kinase [Glaciecola sp. XM2]
MNRQLKALFDIANKDEKWIIGTMSGTSLDGLDIALCKVKGHGKQTTLELVHFTTQPYQQDYKDLITPLFANSDARLEDVCLANTWVAHKHAAMINETLAGWHLQADDIDLLASHGQTVFHAPRHSHSQPNMPNATLQIGDGDHIAQLTGIITISDFRQKHVAAGGEGAPMVKYGDYLLFVDDNEYRVLLNLGGIANLSVIPPKAYFSDIISTDTGPANTFMDALVQQHLAPKRYDHNGELAAKGVIDDALLTKLLTHPFLTLPCPKSTGQEAFSITWLNEQLTQCNLTDIALEDMLATLCAFSAKCVANAINQLIPAQQALTIYVSGGGAHNAQLLAYINAYLPNATLKSMSALGINVDAKEAALFALLANECICSDASVTFANSSHAPAVSMGKICLPN